MQYMTKAYTRKVAAAKKASVTGGNFSGPLTGAYVGLAKSLSGNPGPGQVWDNLVECDFNGYARLALGTLNGPFDSTSGSSILLSAALKFAATDAVKAQTATHVFLADGVGATPVLLGIEALPGNGVGFNDDNSGMEYVFRDGEDLAGGNLTGVVMA